MTSRIRRLLVVPVLLLGLVAASSTAAAQEAEPANLLTGTLEGTDGRAVNALLGFDWQNAEGRRIDRHGCVQSAACPLPGYASVVRVNPTLTAEGTSDTSTATTTWEVPSPPGAVQVFIEAYPQNERFRTDEARYGHAMRHSVPLPHNGPLPLKLPVTRCDDGGTVGSIRGTGTVGLQPTPLRRVVAWSLEAYDPITRPVIGWNIGTASADGTFVVPNLVPDQRYQLWVTAADGTVRKQFGVVVNRCAETRTTLAFDPPHAPYDGPAASPSAAPAPEPPPSPTLQQPLITAGQAAMLDGAAEPGTAVELLASTRPGGAYRVVRTTTASPSGYYSFSVQPPTATDLKVRVGRQDSASVLLRVRSAVSMTPAATATPRTLRFAGRVSPARGGTLELFLRLGNGGRRLLASTPVRSDGTYLLVRRFAALGSFDVFTASRATGLNEPGRSAVRRVTVR